MMETLNQLMEAGKAGLTVYSPDCTQSRLWGNLDHTIHAALGFQPIYRCWVKHDFNSINRFYATKDEPEPVEQDPIEGAKKYETVPVESLQYGHLVGQLFLSGPALLTIWQGENAVERILALKGATQPPQASKNTIRGGFWCDNGVANLTHASDDVGEMRRELNALRLSALLDGTYAPLPLLEPRSIPVEYVPHCAISVVCDVVNRLLMCNTSQHVDATLPPSGDAHETNAALTAQLTGVRATLPATAPDGIAEFIDAYLGGNVIETTHLMARLPVTKWEHFIIQCGAITRYTWQ